MVHVDILFLAEQAIAESESIGLAAQRPMRMVERDRLGLPLN
jgi:hypothetical protein